MDTSPTKRAKGPEIWRSRSRVCVYSSSIWSRSGRSALTHMNTWACWGIPERQLRASFKKADMGQNHQIYSPKETLEDFALKLQVTHQTLTSSGVEIL